MASISKVEKKKINGTVVLIKKRPLDLVPSEVVQQQAAYEILGHKVTLQLISSFTGDSGDFLFQKISTFYASLYLSFCDLKI